MTTPTAPLGRWPESPRPVTFGLSIPTGEGKMAGGKDPHFGHYLSLTRAAAAAGFAGIWMADHYTLPEEGGGQFATWEMFPMLAGVAGACRDLGLHFGPLVACNSFRHPGNLAKITEALDDITGGKFILGIGAGWNQPEYDAFGIPFDYRVSRFDEGTEIMAQMLRQGEATLEGRFYQVSGAVNRPRGPLGLSGGSPIMIGSRGERMLRILARHADAWNGGAQTDPALLKDMLAKVDAACTEIGRDPATVVKTCGTAIIWDDSAEAANGRLRGTDDEIVASLIAIRDLGIRHITINPRPLTEDTIAHFGKIIARVDEQ